MGHNFDMCYHKISYSLKYQQALIGYRHMKGHKLVSNKTVYHV